MCFLKHTYISHIAYVHSLRCISKKKIESLRKTNETKIELSKNRCGKCQITIDIVGVYVTFFDRIILPDILLDFKPKDKIQHLYYPVFMHKLYLYIFFVVVAVKNKFMHTTYLRLLNSSAFNIFIPDHELTVIFLKTMQFYECICVRVSLRWAYITGNCFILSFVTHWVMMSL